MNSPVHELYNFKDEQEFYQAKNPSSFSFDKTQKVFLNAFWRFPEYIQLFF